MGMRITVLGCGGSLGVPMVGNNWGTCDPANPRNRRRRPSILVESPSTTILVDTGPDLRQQLLDAAVSRVDAILYTHAHADHTHGLDDVRPLVHRQGAPIPAYGDEATVRHLEGRFAYAVTTVEMDRWIYRPILDVRRLNGSLRLGDIEVASFAQDHGASRSVGFRFGPFAYSTDVAELDAEAFATLDGVEAWVVDACREEPHPSHAHLDRALEWIERVGPERAWLTHMNHTMDYDRLCAQLPDHVRPAYDGLVIEI